MSWKKSQTSSGFYKKYKYGYKKISFRFHPKNKIAPKWSVHIFDSGSGSGYLLGRLPTKKAAILFAKKYMLKN